MYIRLVLAAIGMALLSACASIPQHKAPDRVLFVGNSILYYGNAPSVFSSLASANGHQGSSDMLVEGGATLSQRVADGSLARALAEYSYDLVVLQERGGDLMGLFGEDSRRQSLRAIKLIAALGTQHGAKVVLLGTYQDTSRASELLIKEESLAAAEARIPYVEVSQKLQTLRSVAPNLEWFAGDGIHPGKDLTLLYAITLYKEIFAAYPKAQPIKVVAPIYGANSGLAAKLRRADAPPPHRDTPNQVQYLKSEQSKIIRVIRSL